MLLCQPDGQLPFWNRPRTRSVSKAQSRPQYSTAENGVQGRSGTLGRPIDIVITHMLIFAVLNQPTAPTASTFIHRRCSPRLNACNCAQIAALYFQSFTNVLPCAIFRISNCFCTLRTFCQKHPGVGSLATFPKSTSSLTPMGPICFRDTLSKSFRITLFQPRQIVTRLESYPFARRGGVGSGLPVFRGRAPKTWPGFCGTGFNLYAFASARLQRENAHRTLRIHAS